MNSHAIRLVHQPGFHSGGRGGPGGRRRGGFGGDALLVVVYAPKVRSAGAGRS
jgi:hypothetical protein